MVNRAAVGGAKRWLATSTWALGRLGHLIPTERLAALGARAVTGHSGSEGSARGPGTYLGCGSAGPADYLVTGHRDLLAIRMYRGVTILTARELLGILGSHEPAYPSEG
jgi:hypothetical protein